MRNGLPLVALLLATACTTVPAPLPVPNDIPAPLNLVTSEPLMTYPATRRMDLVIYRLPNLAF